MGLKKCPKCELNYIKDDEKVCNICRRSSRKEPDIDDQESLCIECGEHPAIKGRDICALCYKELLRQEQLQTQRKAHISEMELDVVELKEVAVPTPDDEDEIIGIEEELDADFNDDEEPEDEVVEPIDDGEIEFNEDEISVEVLEDDDLDDDEDDIDEGVAPARRTHRSGR